MDYHIYVHNQQEEKPTKPKKPTSKPTKPKQRKSPVAYATAAFKMAEKAFTTFDSFAAAATGDYRYRMHYQNYKAMMAMAVNPFSAIGILRQEQETALSNKRAELQRELLGDSMINERTRKV